MKRKLRNSLLWVFEYNDLIKKNYLESLDFIKENTSVDHICISPRNGVQIQNLKQCHGVLKEITEYAHKIGLEISVHLHSFHHRIYLVVLYFKNCRPFAYVYN